MSNGKSMERIALAVESMAATYARANRTELANGEPFDRFTTCPHCRSQWSPAELKAARQTYRGRVGDKIIMRSDARSYAVCPHCNTVWGW